MAETKRRLPAMRHIFEILRDEGDGAVNDHNEPADNAQTIETIRGAIDWESGSQSTEAAAQRKTQVGVITTRYHTTLSESDKLRFKGTERVLEIDWVHRLDELPHLMEIHVVERK